MGKPSIHGFFFPLPRSVEHLLRPSQRFRRNGWSTWTKWPWTVLRRWRWSPTAQWWVDGNHFIHGSKKGGYHGRSQLMPLSFVKVHLYTSYSMPGIFGHPYFHTQILQSVQLGLQDPRRTRICEPSHAQPKGGRYGAPGQLPGDAWPMSLWGYSATCGLLVQEPDAQSMLNPCSVHLAGCWHVTCWSDKIWHENRLVQDFVHCVGISQSFCDFEKNPCDGSFLEVRTTPKLQPKHVPCRHVVGFAPGRNLLMRRKSAGISFRRCSWETQ